MDNYIITLLIQKKEDNCKNINEVKLEVMDALHEEGTYEPLDVYATTQIEKAYAAGRSPVSYTHLTLPTNREV